jgi:hypothetical protein
MRSNPHDKRFAQLLSLERTLCYRQLCEDPDHAIQVIEGDLPVLVSAAHSCAHRRSGIMKMEEEFTAAMAAYLAGELGCSAIFLRNATTEDPNYQQHARYKERLRALCDRCDIRFVIDLHGMINRHGMGVALGTMHDRACNGALAQRPFLAAGFESINESQLAPGFPLPWRRLVLNHSRFTGGIRSHTVTRFAVEALDLPALQVELASMCRVVYSAPGEGWPHAYAGVPRAIAASVDALRALVLAAANGALR